MVALVAVTAAGTAHADVDPTSYYDDLRSWGDFQVDASNENYFLSLASIVCNMENAGISGSDIGDYIARRESLTNRQGSRIQLSASIYICTQLHPNLLAPGH
ncbi:hypothetical protein BST42_27075 [Mycolicibacterium rhodesiae]|uniref:DUF732 domain-containing protein n=1 Tax=Mycolicibacterium rhodesiae TaxID=36814 RepID=A0A1X0IJ39_MYCRH|nr:hypothetical protein BST42_27075 [Mycolicibacterium rhodesiae]